MVCKPWEQINNLTSPLLTSTTFSFSSVFIFSPALHPSFFFFLSFSLFIYVSVSLSILSVFFSRTQTLPQCRIFFSVLPGECIPGWMLLAGLAKPLVKQSATLAVSYMQAKEKEKSKLVRRLIAEKCLSVQLFL